MFVFGILLSRSFFCRSLSLSPAHSFYSAAWLQRIHDHMWHICFSLSFRAWYFEITVIGMHVCVLASLKLPQEKQHTVRGDHYSDNSLADPPMLGNAMCQWVCVCDDNNGKNPINIPYTITHKVKGKRIIWVHATFYLSASRFCFNCTMWYEYAMNVCMYVCNERTIFRRILLWNPK